MFLGPRDAFDASTHNGVTSSQYGPWSGSFAFVIAPGPRRRQSDPVALPDPSSWHSHVGETFDIDVVGSSQGTVWGTTVYTDDSPLAVAAVHAGVLDPGQRAKVRVTILPGRDSYEGTSRHGVTSYSYTRWGRSYFVERVPNADPAAAPDPKPVLEPVTEEAAPQSLSGYRSRVGETLRLRLTGEADGWIWGSDVYTDDSSPAAAAVHAGALRVGETGTVQVTILPGRSSYPGSTRNGITSQDWEAFAGSFRIERAKPDRESVDDDRLPR